MVKAGARNPLQLRRTAFQRICGGEALWGPRSRPGGGDSPLGKTSNVNDKAGKLARDVAGAAEDVARQAGGTAKGLRHRVQGSPPKSLNDPTLTRKVETVVFRDSKAPKRTVSVNTADGVVYLRGTVRRPEQIRTL